MRDVTVDINCPKCAKKALFHSVYVGTYTLYPAKEGRLTCKYCGLNKPHVFSNKDYYYQIPIGNRTLYARTREYLIALRNFFQSNERYDSGGPESDLPRLFYVKRREIVKKIDALLLRELECR